MTRLRKVAPPIEPAERMRDGPDSAFFPGTSPEGAGPGISGGRVTKYPEGEIGNLTKNA
jgi:hypothetical protein